MLEHQKDVVYKRWQENFAGRDEFQDKYSARI
jgi:hypothetical protein